MMILMMMMMVVVLMKVMAVMMATVRELQSQAVGDPSDALQDFQGDTLCVTATS